MTVPRATSAWLVAFQLALIAVIVFGTQLPASPRSWSIAIFLLAMSVVLLAWTLGHNRFGNFSVFPEVRHDARLVTSGPYRWVRHPMYTAILLGAAAFVAVDSRFWRVAGWVALLAVLIAKAAREESYLRAKFPDYTQYASRTRRFVPFVF
jgi:protein-S-isoprenylcysteine O-methyltransferase Ste14